jgi:outer membrane protein assembly factor BamB
VRTLSVVMVLAASTVASASDWPRFLGPNGDGTTTDKSFTPAWPKAGPKELWTVTLGVGYAPPTVAGGKLFHFDRFGDANRLTCRDAVTRKEIWKAEFTTKYEDQYGFESGPRCCPVVDRDRVFVYDPEGLLAAYAVADGKEIWKLDTRETYRVRQNFFGVASTPWVEGDTLIVAVGGSPRGPAPADFLTAKSDSTCLIGFDVATGKEKWRCGDDLASYASPTVVSMNGKRVGLYFARGGLVGFDPVAGKQLFRHPWRARILESVNAANPVVSGDKILFSESYQHGSCCLRWDGTTLSEVWTDKGRDRDEIAMMAHWCTPILHDGFVYGCSSRHTTDADIRCVEFATGAVKWVEKRTRWHTLAKVNDTIVALGEGGEVKLIKPNPQKYEVLAAFEADLPAPAWAPPVVAGGKMYLRGKGKLVCFDLSVTAK